MTKFSSLDREQTFTRLAEEEFDLLVIGGGITGAGIALDATTRGLKTALVEMQDFASGTSSRSTKLVHGGLRYLKQFQIKEVADLGKERAIVYENGPHVTTPEWMLLPFHKGGTFGKYSTSLGLKVYDFLAGVKRSERRTMLSMEETIKKAPLVKREGLLGGGVYVEYRTDDARLTMEVIKAAAEKGTTITNYAKAQGFIYNDKNRISGVEVIDQLTGKKITIQAKAVINAAGPWVDEVKGIEGSKSNKHLILSKGVHIVFDQKDFPLHQAVYFDTQDKRMIFAVPRDGKTYVGTTDTFYKGDPKVMQISEEDRTYLLGAIDYMFPELTLTEEHIESSWAGVRPLIHEEGKSPSEVSRKDEIWESEKGLITMAGGKLTGYRKMAETVINRVAKRLAEEENIRTTACATKNLPISGGDMGGSANMPTFLHKKIADGKKIGLSEEMSRKLAVLYGTNVDQVYAYVEEGHAELPAVLYAQLRYAIDFEMAAKPVDFFIRRTGSLYFNIAEVQTYKKPVIEEMASIFDWSDAERAAYTEELEVEIKRATTVL